MTSPHVAAAGVPPIDLDAAPAPSLVTRPEPHAADAPEPAPAPAGSPWPLWQRLLFRFGLLYFLLYAFVPDGQGNSWWQPITTWMHEHGLAPYEVIHQQTGSGDTGHDFAKLLALPAFAAVGTLLWSLLQRRSGHPMLWKWAHMLVRFTLATHLLGYGLHKFFGGQFGTLGPMRLLMRVGDVAPMTMVGTFMQASKPYELFGGGGEVLAALLLFHRRTAGLGAMVAIGVMTNVAALNWLCGVPVKLYSAHLLLFAFAVLLPFVPGLWSLLVRMRPAPAIDLRLARGERSHPVVALLCWGFVAWYLVTALLDHSAPRPWLKNYQVGPLYGVWQVERVVLDGAEVAPQDAAAWRYLAIDRGKMAFVEQVNGQRHWLELTLDESATHAEVLVRGAAAAAAKDLWTIETGTKTAKVPPPLRLRPQDWQLRVDEERRTLVVRGTWHGKPLELHAIEKRFPLQTGFRLRQELPDGW